jgi:hypothetical protein
MINAKVKQAHETCLLRMPVAKIGGGPRPPDFAEFPKKGS